MEFLNSISEKGFFDNVFRPDTYWKIYRATNICSRFEIYWVEIYNSLGGDIQLLDYIKFNRGPLKKQTNIGVKLHVKMRNLQGTN